jgi:hypothetical protein
MDKCNLHTILRLPTGIFYAQGVKTNVLFFTRGETDKGNTREVWVYDMRANMPQFGKRTPFSRDYFRTPADAPADTPRDKFEDVFGDDPQGGPKALARRVDTGETGRWRKYTREQIAARGDNLDISWLKDDSAETAEAQRDEPALVARLALRELNAAVSELRALLDELGKTPIWRWTTSCPATPKATAEPQHERAGINPGTSARPPAWRAARPDRRQPPTPGGHGQCRTHAALLAHRPASGKRSAARRARPLRRPVDGPPRRTPGQRVRPWLRGKNLRRMVQFAQAFPDTEIVASLMRQLSWTHFLQLLPLKTEPARHFYARQCMTERWSVRELHGRSNARPSSAVKSPAHKALPSRRAQPKPHPGPSSRTRTSSTSSACARATTKQTSKPPSCASSKPSSWNWAAASPL